MAEYERRAVVGLEVRQGGGQPSRLRGYAAVFNSQSLDLGGFVEIIRPGAFTRSLKDTDVFAFVEHDPAQIIGRRSAGTLVIGEDAHGLHVEITPIKTRVSEDVIENVRVGHLDAMSFAFRIPPDGDQWDLKATPPRRELLHVDLREVSVVAMPAYPATEVAMRSLEAIRSQAGKYPRGRTVAERRAWATAHAR
jgi:HK97 family phage prohead protease